MSTIRTPAYRSLRILMLLGLTLLGSFQALGSGLQASLDRTRIYEGETVMLRLSVPGQPGAAPDLSPLLQDFEILDRGQSTRMQVINGYASSSHDWQFILAPKRTGNLQVPALQAGNQQSQALALAVIPAQQAAQAGAQLPVAIEVDAMPVTPYVQGKVIYKVRMWVSVPMTRTNLGDPEGHGVVIEPLGNFKRRKLRRGGKEYLVVERSYAIFPQQSGPLVIKGPVFTGELAQTEQKGSQRRRSSPFGGRDPFANLDRLFGSATMPKRNRMFYMRGRDISLDVQPQPAGAAQPWLPAEAISLEESWSPNPPQFRVGQPLTRSVALNARGVTGAQLPDLTFDSVPGIAIYQDKSQVQTRLVGPDLLARKVFTAAYVPSWAGTHQLPEITLTWWDTLANQPRVARIPGGTVEVLPGAGGVTRSPRATTSAAASPQALEATAQQESSAAVPQETLVQRVQDAFNAVNDVTRNIADAGYWPWLTALFAAAWLISTGLWWRNRRRGLHRDAGEVVKVKPPSAKGELRLFKRACEANDPRAAREHLLEWAAARWPEDSPRGLDELSRRLPQQVAGYLAALDQELYAPGEHAWNGAEAWETLSPVLQASKVSAAATGLNALPPLYPRQR